jgi:hypothetical protein
MSKVLLAIFFLCLPILVLAQTSATSPRYQPATIIAVSPHQSAGDSAPGDALYEVSVKVKRTLYVVVTKSPSPSGIIQYAVGREVLVQVGDDKITWNDIMGESHEVPIISRTLIMDTSTAQSGMFQPDAAVTEIAPGLRKKFRGRSVMHVYVVAVWKDKLRQAECVLWTRLLPDEKLSSPNLAERLA